ESGSVDPRERVLAICRAPGGNGGAHVTTRLRRHRSSRRPHPPALPPHRTARPRPPSADDPSGHQLLGRPQRRRGLSARGGKSHRPDREREGKRARGRRPSPHRSRVAVAVDRVVAILYKLAYRPAELGGAGAHVPSTRYFAVVSTSGG